MMKISKRMWKHFDLKMKPEVTKWRKSHTHKPWGESNLRELRDWFPCKCLIHRQPRLISWQMKTIQKSLPVHSQASQFTTWTLARPLLFALKLKSESESCSVVSDSLRPHGLHSPWNSPGQNTGAGSLSLLQGIFPTQGPNPGLPLCRQILYQLSHKGSPRLLEWGAYPFSSRSSPPRNRTGVYCVAGGFFTSWATREARSESLNQVRFFATLWTIESMEFSRSEYWSG